MKQTKLTYKESQDLISVFNHVINRISKEGSLEKYHRYHILFKKVASMVCISSDNRSVLRKFLDKMEGNK